MLLTVGARLEHTPARALAAGADPFARHRPEPNPRSRPTQLLPQRLARPMVIALGAQLETGPVRARPFIRVDRATILVHREHHRTVGPAARRGCFPLLYGDLRGAHFTTARFGTSMP